ncbi:MAG: acyltransferase family protein [Ruminococcus sp.]|nr:acyltransferase family protein [Ruminococcus sp.]
MTTGKRLGWADCAKGIGIILVVLGHTIVPSIYTSNVVAQFIREFIYNFHMQLFFFISGYLFEYGIDKYSDKKRFIISKARRLLLPYVFFSAFAYCLIAIILRFEKLAVILKDGGYYSRSFFKAVFETLTHQGHIDKHLWFVYTLFFIFVINIFFVKALKHPVTLIILYLFCLSAYSFNHYAILSSLLKYMFYFSLARFCVTSEKPQIYRKLSFTVLTVAFIIINVGATSWKLYLKSGDSSMKIVDFKSFVILISLRILGTIIAVLGIAVVCRLALIIKSKSKSSKVLSVLGDHSFDIYLMHVPFLVSGIVGVLLKYTSLPVVIICFIALVLGLLLPILITNLIIRRVPILNTIVLGEKFKRNNRDK